MSFASILIKWYHTHHRSLPWRGTTDAYVIWLSEIILQQTRVAQGTPYFHKFLQAYPTISHFAAAPQQHILKLWQGLGYYSRARNMHAAAIVIAQQYKGTFPASYTQLLQLPGIGAYTAAAIASFAFNLPHAVVDGNVYRVLARYFGISLPINSSAGIKHFAALAGQLLPKGQAGLYNQAIMEFGALQCTPASPACPSCPLAATCVAYTTNTIAQLPVKLKAAAKRSRYFHYFICTTPQGVYIQARSSGDIWQGLYQFPLIETHDNNIPHNLAEVFTPAPRSPEAAWHKKHVLTHQNIFAGFYILPYTTPVNVHNYTLVPHHALATYPFPQLIALAIARLAPQISGI